MRGRRGDGTNESRRCGRQEETVRERRWRRRDPGGRVVSTRAERRWRRTDPGGRVASTRAERRWRRRDPRGRVASTRAERRWRRRDPEEGSVPAGCVDRGRRGGRRVLWVTGVNRRNGRGAFLGSRVEDSVSQGRMWVWVLVGELRPTCCGQHCLRNLAIKRETGE